MKVIVAHPYKQHSFRTAEAFLEEHSLYAYITSVYLKRGNITNLVFSFAGDQNKKRAQTHKSELLDSSVVQYDEVFGLFMTFLRRISLMNRVVPKLDLMFFKHFGRKVAKYAIREKVDAVVMYDKTAMWCFKYLKENHSNIKCIIDMSAITLDGQEKSFRYDSERCTKQWYHEEIDKKCLENGIKELQYSDGYIVASDYTKNDLINHGISKEKIYTIPYGYEQECLNKMHEREKEQRSLRVLYAGRITHEKGVHHLLSALSDIDDREIELTLAGSYTADPDLYEEYKNKKNYNFVGFAPKNQLYKLYSENDVLVVPSLSDGYGLVVLEGMSCGLPVVASSCTGASSIIENRVNGIKYDAYSEVELKDAIVWFLQNKNCLSEMKIAAQKTVSQYTWESYYKRVYQAVKHIVQGGNNDSNDCFKL